MHRFKLVIFDCDGVLVDSEYLAGQIYSEILREEGFSVTEEDTATRYLGLSFEDILKHIEKESGKPVSATLIDKTEQRFKQRMKKDLNAVDGVRACVEEISRRLRLPYCICSNSNSANIEAMLTHVKIYDLFRGRIFSAPEIGTKKPKPAPDAYQFAAKQARVAPSECIVLEDSVNGATAAHKAGMAVVGFTGGSHALPRLSGDLMEAGAETVIARLRDFPATIQALDKFQE